MNQSFWNFSFPRNVVGKIFNWSLRYLVCVFNWLQDQLHHWKGISPISTLVPINHYTIHILGVLDISHIMGTIHIFLITSHTLIVLPWMLQEQSIVPNRSHYLWQIWWEVVYGSNYGRIYEIQDCQLESQCTENFLVIFIFLECLF